MIRAKMRIKHNIQVNIDKNIQVSDMCDYFHFKKRRLFCVNSSKIIVNVIKFLLQMHKREKRIIGLC